MALAAQKVIFDGKLLPEEQAAIPTTSRGLMYGDGCFETLRSYRGGFLKLYEHLKRLEEGLMFLSIPYPDGLRSGKLLTQLKNILNANNLMNDDAVIRLQVWRKGSRGYSFSATDKASYSITATLLS